MIFFRNQTRTAFIAAKQIYLQYTAVVDRTNAIEQTDFDDPWIDVFANESIFFGNSMVEFASYSSITQIILLKSQAHANAVTSNEAKKKH